MFARVRWRWLPKGQTWLRVEGYRPKVLTFVSCVYRACVKWRMEDEAIEGFAVRSETADRWGHLAADQLRAPRADRDRFLGLSRANKPLLNGE